MRLRFDIKGASQEYEARTGLRLTYSELSSICGLSQDTIKSLASRTDYNTSLQVISQISNALNINPLRFLIWESDNEGNEKT